MNSSCFVSIFILFTDLLPEGVRNNISRSRAVRMLQSALSELSPSKAWYAAIWLESRVYKALCATAMEISSQAFAATSSSWNKGDPTSSKITGAGTGTGDATIATQGAGSAFNKYLAHVTRLTFALQVNI